ncbi:RNA polymerase sigma factor SigI [Bacillus sp. CGMCC 1.16541]|uniref:RNA polymerase sigma factor SigI n=1 Tax=Bacillus sp. CGMCC 1.16541 TaxID=2185143 RepID=UPI000D72E704|nr:RNA polymerase sigma factor SigI [Bacillus sp. CGMCC 1.16541]
MKPLLNILFKFGRQRTLEEMAVQVQKGDTQLQNDLIEQYKPFIAKAVSSVCKRYIEESDDEFSIGLIAFNEAIEKYTKEKGSSLLSFAEVIIKRRVIDHIRKEARLQTFHLHGYEEEEEEFAQTKLEANLSLHEHIKKIEQEIRRDEILHFQSMLETFDLSFHEIVEQSPKHADARINAIQVATFIAEHEEIKAKLFKKKQLPIRLVEKNVSVSRKTIERNRKYIIAIVIVLTGDYVYLKDYLKGVLNS